MNPHDLFEVPRPGPYLLSHSVGCLPRASRERLARDLLDPWGMQGSDGWGAWLAAIDEFRGAVARLIGGDVAEICPQPSVSAALTSLLSGLRREKGKDIILLSAHAFPSIGYALKQFERLGYRLELLPGDADPGDAAVWAEAIGPEVAVVVPMHVHSNTGTISPIKAIGDRAREQGAVTIVDACQSAGLIPIEAGDWGVDAIIGSSVKWLCGGPGAAFLWIRQDLIHDVEPINVGWFSHADPFAFDIRDFRYADDARRFWGGTPSVAPYVMATEGIATIARIGVDVLLGHNRRLITAAAESAGVAFDMRARGGTLCLASDDADALAEDLMQAHVRFDRRGPVIRLSFHVWNDEAEARLVGACLRGRNVRLI